MILDVYASHSSYENTRAKMRLAAQQPLYWLKRAPAVHVMGVDIVYDSTYLESSFEKSIQTVKEGGSWIVLRRFGQDNSKEGHDPSPATLESCAGFLPR